MSALTQDIEIINAKGLHVRAATVLAQLAGSFASNVVVEHAGERANAKSVMNLLLLTAPMGAVVTVIVDGEDAEDAMDAVAGLITNGFGEA